MSDFNDKKDSDIKSRLKGNIHPKKVEQSSSPGEGAQENTNAESLRASQPSGKTVSIKNSSGQKLFKSPSNPGPIGSSSGPESVSRPGSKASPKVSVRQHDTALMKLQAQIPNTGTVGDRPVQALHVGQPGSNQGDEQLPGNEYNVKIKDKIALSLRYRIPAKLEKLLDNDPDVAKKLSSYVREQLNINQKNRTEMINRIMTFRESWRNFEQAGLNIDIDGQHNEHIPLIFEKGKALHARIYSAIMSVEPPFVLLPRKSVDEKLKKNKEDLIRWVTSDYMNQMEGIAPETDKDVWNFVLDGTAIVKHYWTRDVRKFVDVTSEPKLPYELDENGQLIMDEKEVEKEAVEYDGPMMRIVPLDDLYIVGPRAEGIDDADMIAHRQHYSKSELIKAANLGFFMADAVDKVLSYQPSTEDRTRGWDTFLAQQEARLSGVNMEKGGIPTYTIHECYLRYDIDKDGIDEEIVVWRDWISGIILRITYLDRVSPTGKRPFVLKKLIPMSGTPYGLGFE